MALAAGVVDGAAAPANAVVAATQGPLTETWFEKLPGEIGQSAPVQVRGTGEIALGSTDGSLTLVSQDSGAVLSGWNGKPSGGTSINAPLSSGGTKRLGVAVSSANPGAPALENWNVSAGVTGFRYGSCTAVIACDRLSGMSWVGSTAFTGGPEQYLHAVTSSGAGAWSFLSSDSTNSTPASANLMGSGMLLVFTDDQTPNSRTRPAAISGGHLRILTTSGRQLCNADITRGPATPGSFDSSPAIAATTSGEPLIVFGTGESGAKSNRLLAYDSACRPVWESAVLPGPTIAAPAIATVSGRPVVYEETAYGASKIPYLYAIDLGTGRILGKTRVAGSAGAACADFTPGTSSSVAVALKGGIPYVFAPAGACGVEVYTGTTLNRSVADLASNCNVQNTPVIDEDSAGVAGITIAGYESSAHGGIGCVFHYRLAGATTGAGAWPEFHHDASLTGAAKSSFTRHNSVQTGQQLKPGQTLTSPNGTWVLTELSDGQLRLRHNGRVAWTIGKPSSGAHLLVTWKGLSEVARNGKTVWSTPARSAASPLMLDVQNSGRVSVFSTSPNPWTTVSELWAKGP